MNFRILKKAKAASFDAVLSVLNDVVDAVNDLNEVHGESNGHFQENKLAVDTKSRLAREDAERNPVITEVQSE